MSSGIRAGLKKVVPVRAWPLFRFFDRYLINTLYIYFAAKRYVAARRIPRHSQLKQSIPVVPSHVDFGREPGVELTTRLEKAGLHCRSGRHSVYLGDPDDIARISPDLAARYPDPVGLKIIKSREMSPDATPYYTSHRLAPASTWFSMVAVGSMREKAVISNLLHEEGLAPRVYDIIRLESGDGGRQYGFLVQPVRGEMVTGEEGLRFVDRFKKTMERLGMETISIREHCDLRPPDFRNNIVADESGTYYVDIQNFVVFSSDYGEELLDEMKHHGRVPSRSEQEEHVPGQEAEELTVFLARNRVEPATSSVLDCGLADETLSMYLLAAGAPWVVLLRQDDTVPLVRRYMYYHGFTRLDVISSENGRSVQDDVLSPWKHDLALVPAAQGEEILQGTDWLPVSRYLIVGETGWSEARLTAFVQGWSQPCERGDTGLVHWDGSGTRAVVLCRTGR